MSESKHQAEPGREPVPARWWPRDVAEQLWETFPGRDVWPFGEAASREIGRPLGVPIRMEEVRDGDHLVIRAELPGIDPEKDVEVTVERGMLRISAERREKSEERESDGYRSEFRYGHVERQVRLPEGTTAEAVSATYKDGVLEVRLPAPPPAPSARKVDVQRG